MDFGHKSEKLCFEHSQIVTVTNCDKSENSTLAICDFVAIYDQGHDVAVWVQLLWKGVHCTCTLLTWIYVLMLFYWYTRLYACVSITLSINNVPRKPSGKGSMSMWTYFMYLGVYRRALLTSIWGVVFTTLTNCDSHKLWQIRKLHRRNLLLCHNLWWRPWSGKLNPITPKTCSVYLGEYPCTLLAWN